MKKFPRLIHVSYEEDQNGEEDYLCCFTNGVDDLDPGARCAIYQLVEEGVIRGPKSFVSKRSHRRTR